METASKQSSAESSLKRLLTTRGFLALTVSSALGYGGEQMRLAAQAWWILDEGGSNTVVGLAAGLRVIPVILIGLYAGVMIDRFGGRRVLLVERWLVIILALATAIILLTGKAEIWHIVMLSTIAGGMIAIGLPSTQTLVAELVPDYDLYPANSLNSFGQSLGRTLGPPLAGALIALRDVATAFIGLTGVYVLSLITTYRLPPSRIIASEDESAFQQIKEGFRYVRRRSALFWILFLQAFSLTFFSMMAPLIPAIALELHEASEVQYGWMWGSQAIGQGTSAVLLVVFGGIKRNRNALLASVTIYSLCLIPAGLTHNYWLALALLFGVGFAVPLWQAATITALQRFSEPAFRGRVMAFFAITMQQISLSWMLGGWLLDVIGVFPTTLIAAGGGTAMLLVALVASKELRSS